MTFDLEPHRRPRVRQREPARRALRPPLVRLRGGGGHRRRAASSSRLNGLWKLPLREEPRARRPRLRARRTSTLAAGTTSRCPRTSSCTATTARSTPTCSTRGTGSSSSSPGRCRSGYNPVATLPPDFTLEHPLEPGERLSVSLPRRGERPSRCGSTARTSGYGDGLVHAVGVRPHRRAWSTGENVIVAQVVRWSAGSWIEDQDFFRFSGLFRDVVLYRRPAVHVEDVRVVTDGHRRPLRGDGARARRAGRATAACDATLAGAGQLDGDERARRPHREPAPVERGGPSPVRPRRSRCTTRRAA